jgi:TP901 family phage tail tape measure protein
MAGAAGGIQVGSGILSVKLDFPDLGRASAGVGAALGKAGQGLGKGIGDVLKGSAPAFRGIGAAIGTSLRGAAPAIKGVGEALGKAGQGVGMGVGSSLRGSAPAIRAVGGALNQSARGFGSGLGQATRGVGAALGQSTRGFGAGLGSVLRGTAAPINAIGNSLGRAARGFGAGLNSTLRGVSSLVTSVSGALTAPFKLLTGGGGLMALLGGGAAAGGVGFIAKEAMGLETSMVRLGRVTGLEGDKLKGLGDQLKEMAATMPGTDLSRIFGIATMGGKLGIEGPALAMFTRDLAKMSVVLEDIPLDEATERMARLLNLFHRGPGDALGLASALNALDMASTASARDILQMSTNMSGMAADLKLTLPQVMALATAMREAGIEPGTGGTAMSQLLQGFTGRREAGLAKLTGLDKSTFRNMVDTKPFEALKTVFNSLNQMDPRARAKTLEELHFTGQRTAGTFRQLMQTFERLSRFEEEANRQFESGTSITKGYGAASATAEAQLGQLWNNIKLVAAELGEGLLPVIKGASTGMVALAGDVRKALEANKDTIAGWGNRVGQVLDYVGTAWRNHRLFVDYALLFMREKWEQTVEVFDRFGKKLSDNFGWAMRSLRKIAENTIPGLVNFLGDLAAQIGTNFIEQMKFAIHTGAPKLAGFLGITGSNVKPVEPKFGLLGKPLAGLEAPPGFGGMLKGLPNRAEELAILEGDIRDARKAMDREVAARRQMADAEEDAARRQARVHGLMGRVLGEREGPVARGMGMRERFRQEQAAANRMLGGPGVEATRRMREQRRIRARMRAARFGPPKPPVARKFDAKAEAKRRAAIEAGGAAARAAEARRQAAIAQGRAFEEKKKAETEAPAKALADAINKFGEEQIEAIIGLLGKIARNGDGGAIFGGP